jgi:hypothetical protein
MKRRNNRLETVRSFQVIGTGRLEVRAGSYPGAEAFALGSTTPPNDPVANGNEHR